MLLWMHELSVKACRLCLELCRDSLLLPLHMFAEMVVLVFCTSSRLSKPAWTAIGSALWMQMGHH